MIQITPHMRVLVYSDHVDFRKGINGLASICKAKMEADPMSGALFVFRNRNKSSLKVLIYDGQGFWLCQKRLSTGRFQWWPSDGNGGACSLSAQELHVLFSAGDPTAISIPPDWKGLKVPT